MAKVTKAEVLASAGRIGRALAGRMAAAGLPVVSPDDAEAILTQAHTVKGDRIVMRKSVPKGASADLRAFMAAIRFHTGANVNLGGIIMAGMEVGSERYDAIDTLAHAYVQVVYGGSRGVEAWRSALGR